MPYEQPLKDEYTGETPEETSYPLQFPRESKHDWVSQGNQVACRSCANPHGFQLPPGMHMTGLNSDGNPIVAKVW